MLKNENFNVGMLTNEIKSLKLTTDINEHDQFIIDVADLFKEQKGKSTKEILESWIDGVDNGISSEDSSFNFYPSSKTSNCKTLCIGVATKKFGFSREKNKNRTGFKGLVKEIIAQWFSCERTEYTILITTDWDQQDFEDNWKQIIDSYTSKKTKTVKIYQFLSNPVGEFIQHYPTL